MSKHIIIAIIVIAYIVFWVLFIKVVETESDREQTTYEEATKWYKSLSESEKAHIMDVIWTKHPSIKNGRSYMISIYTFYTKKER